MRIRHIFLMLLAISAPAAAAIAQQTDQPTLATTPQQELRALTRKWDEAIIKKDLESLHQILAQDYSFADIPRSSYLALMVEMPDIEYSSYERNIREIRIYGDASIVFSHTSVEGKYPGVSFSTTFNSMDIWIRQNGQWKAVATMNDDMKVEPPRDKVQVGPR